LYRVNGALVHNVTDVRQYLCNHRQNLHTYNVSLQRGPAPQQSAPSFYSKYITKTAGPHNQHLWLSFLWHLSSCTLIMFLQNNSNNHRQSSSAALL